MNPVIRDSIVPGSIRVVVTEETYLTIMCGKCHTEHEVHVEPWMKTKRCMRCRRVMQLTGPVALPSNVTPIRKKAGA
jgi:hypothetical protein